LTEEDHYQSNNELIDLMEDDPNPKFRESKFLEFLKNIKSKKYKIKDNKLIVNPNI